MTIEEDFLTTAADKLAENLDRIETCLTELPSHALWARDSDNENAVGNLLLHLEGNVRQWILAGIGAGPDERDRPGEFPARTLRCYLQSCVAPWVRPWLSSAPCHTRGSPKRSPSRATTQPCSRPSFT